MARRLLGLCGSFLRKSWEPVFYLGSSSRMEKILHYLKSLALCQRFSRFKVEHIRSSTHSS